MSYPRHRRQTHYRPTCARLQGKYDSAYPCICYRFLTSRQQLQQRQGSSSGLSNRMASPNPALLSDRANKVNTRKMMILFTNLLRTGQSNGNASPSLRFQQTARVALHPHPATRPPDHPRVLTQHRTNLKIGWATRELPHHPRVIG